MVWVDPRGVWAVPQVVWVDHNNDQCLVDRAPQWVCADRLARGRNFLGRTTTRAVRGLKWVCVEVRLGVCDRWRDLLDPVGRLQG